MTTDTIHSRIFLIIAIVFCAVFAFPALAQTRPVPVDVRQEERVQNAEVRQENRAALADERRSERVAKIKNHTSIMIRRFNQAIEWLGKIADRIASRIEKLKAGGVDTALSEGYLADARTKLDDAKESVIGLEDAVAEALEGEDLRSAFGQVRALVGEARNLIKETHSLLVSAIRNLKPGLNRERSATSTP